MKALPPETQREDDARAEANLLASEMVKAMERFGKECWERLKKPPNELTKCPEGVDPDGFWQSMTERLADTLPADTNWWDLRQLEDLDPELAVQKWEEIKQHAADELRLGHRAAKFVEGTGKPIDRARFLALRRAFIEEWQPRGGIERAVIDVLAQAFTMWEHWAEIATHRVVTECNTSQRDEEEARYWKRQLQSEADGIAMANEQADRWNRIFLRTLRQLRDLRRYSVSIVNAGQVNIAQQQVNVAEPAPPAEN